MALINKKDLKTMPKQEMETKMAELKKELMKENAQVAMGTNPKSPGKIKQMKKMIARILTLQNQKLKTKNEVGKKI